MKWHAYLNISRLTVSKIRRLNSGQVPTVRAYMLPYQPRQHPKINRSEMVLLWMFVFPRPVFRPSPPTCSSRASELKLSYYFNKG